MRPLLSFEKNAEANEAAGTNRWMVSYADFMTLMFVLFLVLYAKLPKPPEQAFPRLQIKQQGMIPGIRQRPPQPLPHASAAAKPVVVTEKQMAMMEDMAQTLGELVAAGDISMTTRQEGVLLEIKDSALFASGTAQYAGQASGILTKVSEILEKGNNLVIVEGHTDSIPIQTAQFPSNWELSSARAASVVRALQEHGIVSSRLTASGLAETKPKTTNETPEGRSVNRRVSLLVLNN